MADEGTGQIKPALHVQMSLRLNLLRKDFTEKSRLGKILRAHDDRIAPFVSAGGKKQRKSQ
jgi:hypothetical protein